LNAAGKDESHQVFLGLGSNIRPEENLPRAVAMLRKAVQLEALSRIWETPPVGSPGPDFLNAAARVKTWLSMDELQAGVLRPIEERLGRVRTDNPNAPRTIDLDILVYDGITIDEGLWEQAHVCIPLSELLPDYTHPLRGETLSATARRFSQTTPLRIREDLSLPDRK